VTPWKKGPYARHSRQQAWPSLPEYLTYSTLREFEACPRRWHVGGRFIPKLWRARVPARLTSPGLPAQCVHDVIDRITRALVKAGVHNSDTRGCSGDARYGRLLHGCSRNRRTHVASYTANPRAGSAPRCRSSDPSISIPRLAPPERSTIDECSDYPGDVAASIDVRSASEYQPTRRPLGSGAHSEVEVIAKEIKWKGQIDLLTISEVGSEIRRFQDGRAFRRSRVSGAPLCTAVVPGP